MGFRVTGEVHGEAIERSGLVAFIREEQKARFSELKEALEESNVPFRVDLHSWNDLPEGFHRNIRQEYAVLQDGSEEGAR